MRSRVAVGLLAAYAALVLLVVAWPSPIDGGQGPLIERALRALYVLGVPTWFNYYVVEFAANVIMFVPLALLLGLVLPGRLAWVPFVVGPLFSVMIEVGQSLFLPDRFGTSRDVVSNSLGAVIGGVLAVVIHRHLDQRGSSKS